jgi:hypothetical protein
MPIDTARCACTAGHKPSASAILLYQPSITIRAKECVMESLMPYRRDNSSGKPGEDKQALQLIKTAISISIAIVLSALLLSFMLTG